MQATVSVGPVEYALEQVYFLLVPLLGNEEAMSKDRRSLLFLWAGAILMVVA